MTCFYIFLPLPNSLFIQYQRILDFGRLMSFKLSTSKATISTNFEAFHFICKINSILISIPKYIIITKTLSFRWSQFNLTFTPAQLRKKLLLIRYLTCPALKCQNGIDITFSNSHSLQSALFLNHFYAKNLYASLRDQIR